MIRNEYRRSFIMLRAIMPGYGGHVRLEKRTLTGSMYFIITAPQGVGELAAALAGCRNGEYYAAPIGALRRDRRGQLALAWQFDPRNIDGRPLEAYPWLAIVATGGPCALALIGNVDGSRNVDALSLERVACALFAPGGSRAAPAADLPEPEFASAPSHGSDGVALDAHSPSAPGESSAAPAADPPVPEFASAPSLGPDGVALDAHALSGISSDGTVPRQTPYDGAGNGGDESHGDVRIYTMTRARLRRLAGRGDRAEAHQGTSALDEQGAAASQASPKAERAPVGPAAGTVGTEPEPAALSVDPITAAKQLGLDITVPWPGVAEALRRLFATQAPAADAPDDGFTYVAWPMPDGSGYRESLVGLKADGGKITAIRHALPARRAPEPPAGMEACQWMPTDGENGFWVTEDRGNEINN